MKARINQVREKIRAKKSPKTVFVIGMFLLSTLMIGFWIHIIPISYEAFQEKSYTDAVRIKTSMIQIQPPTSWEYGKVRAIVHCSGEEPFVVKTERKFGSKVEGCIYYTASNITLEVSTRFFSEKGALYFTVTE